MIKIEIDGKSLEVEPGTMIIRAADAAGIYIPRFCYHEKLSIAANCRMCMVEVEKAPKPMPACATPVADGMVIRTDSTIAVEAQKGTMEFLLINHPLDCPVCDQGGECPLQDQAMGYGKDVSRFAEKKRVVEDKDIGPLIATEMTRCIHCTRCVRFGQEIAGIMELGMMGRGEHSEIGTFLGESVASELSGNVIDLCPVGALTSKPYRFTARSWELTDHDSISPHDCLGTNINIQSIRDRVKRVLPRANEEINECWISDRDRFSYQALNSHQRLTEPMIRQGDDWQKTDWETALNFAADGLQKVVSDHGAAQLGALASPMSTMEEFYLLQKFMRGLGSPNVDHRLRQGDFRDDQSGIAGLGLNFSIAGIEKAKSILLVGSNIRKDQPLLGLRVRKAFLSGAKIMAINSLDYGFHFDLAHKAIVPPSQLAHSMSCVVSAAYGDSEIPTEIRSLMGDQTIGQEDESAIAEQLSTAADQALIIVGDVVRSHRQGSVLRGLAHALAQKTGANLGVLPDANSTAGWFAGCIPHLQAEGVASNPVGYNALEMIANPLQGYILLGAEPGLDCVDGRGAVDALDAAQFVVAMNAFDISTHTPADVLLPMGPYSETSGTYINCERKPSSIRPAATCLGESRPAWKILRVLGNYFELDGFAYTSSAEVAAEMNARKLSNPDGYQFMPSMLEPTQIGDIDLERISDTPLYRTDGIVRRAPALQETRDSPAAFASTNSNVAQQLGIEDGDTVNAHCGEVSVNLPLLVDHAVPDGCVYIPSGYEQTMALGNAATVRVVRS